MTKREAKREETELYIRARNKRTGEVTRDPWTLLLWMCEGKPKRKRRRKRKGAKRKGAKR
jgi:hypothetical protein